MRLWAQLTPRSMAGQMMAILASTLVVLLAILVVFEIRQHRSVSEWATSDFTLRRLTGIKPMLETLEREQLSGFLDLTSRCHAGYTVTDEPFVTARTTSETQALAARLAGSLALASDEVAVGHATLTRDDFSYRKCQAGEIALPMDGIVISLRLRSGLWLNAEVHPHEWHLQGMTDWALRSIGAFVLTGLVALLLMRGLGRPLRRLTEAAQRFGSGLQISPVEESGPADLRRALRVFNDMQQKVADEVERRAHALAAISHDVRTPLTALRIKAELVEPTGVREDLIVSIQKMEKITASALDFLRGESRDEPRRLVDLSALVESECRDVAEMGRPAAFVGGAGIHGACRPDALVRAVRNLIENAVEHGGGARVEVRRTTGGVAISVSDRGPGIPGDQLAQALEPFQRLSRTRDSDRGGFGLGLAVARAIAQGHDGELTLAANHPSGMVATITLPAMELRADGLPEST